MEKMYRIEKYAADGHSGPEAEYVIEREIRSIKEARAVVRNQLGLARLSAARRWGGCENTVEAYHDFPASHSRAYGCGGVAIVVEET